MVALDETFGISANVHSPSYVDRGHLDARFRRALDSDRHIAVHGGSKQGKSWLRMRGLSQDESIVIQCTPSSTAVSVLREALGRLGVSATLSMTAERELQGSLDLKGAGELGKFIAKAKIEGRAQGSVATTNTVESEPIGQTAADLSWVSRLIAASNKRLVLEDFHYISEEAQREFSFLLKAMGEYGLYVIVVGVWPKDHLLTYYNGDLEGRVEDIQLRWQPTELREVLTQGADALRIKFSEAVLASIVGEASGSVGLLQRLAEQICLANGVNETTPMMQARRHVDTGVHFDSSKTAVAEQMQGRFQTFADNFVRGMRRLPEGLEVYRHLLEAITDATDEELVAGIDSAVLLSRISEQAGGDSIRLSDLTQALDRIDRLQVKIDVRPPVLAYSTSGRRLFLADLAFLFYRRNGNPVWPWMSGNTIITNDLAADDPLELDL